MTRHAANVKLLFSVAERLGHLRGSLVFCGGCVTGLLITDSSAGDVSSTKDVDAIVEAASLGQYADTQAALRTLGFQHDLSKDAPACRFLVDGIMVDVMPTDGTNFGWATTYYPAAVRGAKIHNLTVAERSLDVKVISAPLFIATKLEAFADRGAGDYMGSKDIADILAVIDGRPELEQELTETEAEPQDYVRKAFARLLADPSFVDGIEYNVEPGAGEGRASEILARIGRMATI